jgi:hypothetical protein
LKPQISFKNKLKVKVIYKKGSEKYLLDKLSIKVQQVIYSDQKEGE